jgi:phosphoglycolate phosphatase
MFRLIIFDFDDTLVHLGVNWAAVRKDVVAFAKKHGIKIDTKQHLVLISNSVAAQSSLKKDVDDIFEKHEGECLAEKSYFALPQMIEVSRHAKTKGYKLAVASGNCKSTIEAILSGLGILANFDVICGRDCIEKNKPSPGQILFIISKLGVKKEETLFIGNSNFDELAASAAEVAYFRVKDPEKDAKRISEMLDLQ